jgi:thioesterase domain-containing protein
MEPFWPGGDGENLDVQALAARYASAICSREKDSLITLVGHSFGGTIAFETARLLEQRSKRVCLVLLDATLLNPRILEKLAGADTDEDHDISLFSDDSGVTQLPSVDSEYLNDKSSNKLLVSARELYREHCRIFSSYTPDGTFCGTAIAVLAEDGVLRRQLRSAFLLEAQAFFSQKLILSSTEGDHLSMLSVPEVETLASVLTCELAGLSSPENTDANRCSVESQNVC